MAYELPGDLIRQVQLATRAESGLSHYDPTQNLSPLPSISETVASFDPSPPYLRCKNCKGRLLRGVQSVLCVFCGRPTDNLHDPICFKDSIAFGWLLESLNLDGSEIVGPLLERGDLDRVQSRPDEGTRVSELLDFKICWPDEQKRGISLSAENLEEVSLIKFSGFNLDNFLHESRRLDVARKSEAHEVMSLDVATLETKAVSTNNLSFFENASSSESAFQSSEDKDNHEFSGWEADFQSANSGIQFGGSKSFGLDANSVVAPRNDEVISEKSGSPFDMSSHLDTIFGSVKNSKDAGMRSEPITSSSIGDFDSDYMWSNFNPKAPLEIKETDPTITTKDTLSQDNMSNVDISYQLESMFAPKKEKNGKEDSDLTLGPSDSDWPSDNLWNNLSSETPQQSELPVTTPGLTNAVQLDNTNNPSSSSDWFQADQWELYPKPGNIALRKDDASISDSNDFTNSIPVQDFSNNAPKYSSMTASGCTSDLFNSDNNLEEMDFGSFSQADPFHGSSNKEMVSTEFNDIGAAGSDRASNWNGDTEGNLVQLNAANAGVKPTSTQTREDVETLLSQMHDLSFMLEDKLSIPPKV